MSMFYTRVQNKGFELIPTHYIVGCTWDRVKVNELEHVVWATLNADANLNWIHIEIVWDFNQWVPNDAQYDTVNQLIQWIKEKHPDIEIKGHKDFQAKNCPWKNFDWSRIGENQSKQEDHEWITFSLSRYYTVEPNQKRYYMNRSYEEDFWINCAWDCHYTADWHHLVSEDAWKTVACPSEYELWTKFYIEWVWEVICHDRWWKIVMQWEKVRLDLWMWLWDTWLDNIYNNLVRWWEYRWYIIK